MHFGMARRVLPIALVAILCGLLAGCGVFERPQRPAWRAQAEKICVAEKRVQVSAYVQPTNPIDGPGICGLEQPFRVSALAEGTVALNSTYTLGCPMIAAMDEWLRDVVQPVAMARFGQPVAQVDSMGTYSCRSIDNQRGARLSEHAFGNALDVGGFRLADGRSISVVKAWNRGDEQEKAFLREVQAGACNIFTTVLAPGSDTFHYNHIHLDLAMHGATSTGPRRVCKPQPLPQFAPPMPPRDGLPNAPDIDDDIDVAQAGHGNGSSRSVMAMGSLDAGLPPVPMNQSARPAPGAGAPMPLASGRAAGASYAGQNSAQPLPPPRPGPLPSPGPGEGSCGPREPDGEGR
jgi:hypothetical protein